jgi:hypothetical protein
MIFKKITFLIFAFMFSATAFSQIIYLSCNGTLSCQGCSDSKKVFDLAVNTKSGEMSEFPINVAFGCSSSSQLKETFSITETVAIHKCSTPNFTSSLTLSRRTGALSTFTITNPANLKDSKESPSFSGEFRCTKSTSKLF